MTSGEAGPDVVLPGYGQASLAEVLPSVAAAVGMPYEANVLALPPADRYVVLLVDGLGQRLLQRHVADAPYLGSLLQSDRTLTAPVPSTTATSLTTLGTGRAPGAHGVVGFTCRIPGTDRLLNALQWDTGVEPRRWQPHATVFERAANAGVAVTAVNQRTFRGSGLTVASMRGGRYVGANTAGERIAAVAAAAARSRSITYTYDSDLDSTGHRVGCRSVAWRHQLGVVDDLAARLRDALPADACLVVTADHGMVDVGPDDPRVDVDVEVGLLDGVDVFGGEGRFRHLYCAAGVAYDVAQRWSERLGDAALVLKRADAVNQGWFGGVDGSVRERIGDVLVACLDSVVVVSPSRFPAEKKMVGFHGSLTAEEMLVPLLVDAGT